jgi:dTMP kinase
MQPGKLISFEGIDGSGKSSNINFVTELLVARGIRVTSTREPGGTPLGEKIRAMTLNDSMHIETEALLMFASRREHLAQVIEPALTRGDYVLTDRFTDSSFAFQGGGRKLSLEKLNTLENFVHPNLQPDLTFLFDVPTDVAQARMAGTRNPDRFEQEKLAFHNDVRSEYLRRAAQFPDRFRVIDATKSLEDVRTDLKAILLDALAAWSQKGAPKPKMP